jgi:hypothetical protein
MTIRNLINLLNRSISETTKKSEIKVYRDFIKILTNLENRSFSKTEIQSIETELDALTLNSTTKYKIKHLKKSLQQFKSYLKDSFSLITKGYYNQLGITYGATIGLLSGIIFLSDLQRSLGVSLGISAGTLIGILIANYLEAQAKTSGRLI